jgi:hypothetical protein
VGRGVAGFASLEFLWVREAQNRPAHRDTVSGKGHESGRGGELAPGLMLPPRLLV